MNVEDDFKRSMCSFKRSEIPMVFGGRPADEHAVYELHEGDAAGLKRNPIGPLTPLLVKLVVICLFGGCLIRSTGFCAQTCRSLPMFCRSLQHSNCKLRHPEEGIIKGKGIGHPAVATREQEIAVRHAG